MKKTARLICLLMLPALLFSCKNKKSEPDFTKTLDAIEDSLDRVDSIQRELEILEEKARADSAARADSILFAELTESEVEQIEADDIKKSEAGLSADNDALAGRMPDAIPASKADKKPLFEGDENSNFNEWVNDNVVYPESCREAELSGKVIVAFTVDREGNVKNVQVLRSSGVEAFDKAAVSTVERSPKWLPGQKNGEAVDVAYSIPVRFQAD